VESEEADDRCAKEPRIWEEKAIASQLTAVNHIPSTSGASQHQDLWDQLELQRFQHICTQSTFLSFSPEELRWKYHLERKYELYASEKKFENLIK
jgi:hypothetical protein